MSLPASVERKRHDREMRSRQKRQDRRTHYGEHRKGLARWRAAGHSWLSDLAESLEAQKQKAAEARARQAQESRQTIRAMSDHAPKGLMGRIKAFFRGRGR